MGCSPLQSSTVATAGWPLVSAMNAASSSLPWAGHGWKLVTPLMGIFLEPAAGQNKNHHNNGCSVYTTTDASTTTNDCLSDALPHRKCKCLDAAAAQLP